MNVKIITRPEIIQKKRNSDCTYMAQSRGDFRRPGKLKYSCSDRYKHSALTQIINVKQVRAVFFLIRVKVCWRHAGFFLAVAKRLKACATLGWRPSLAWLAVCARGQKGFTANKQSYSSSLNGNSEITKDALEKASRGISIVNAAAPTFKRERRRFCLRRENNTVFMTRITQTQQHNTTLFDDGWVYIHTKESEWVRIKKANLSSLIPVWPIKQRKVSCCCCSRVMQRDRVRERKMLSTALLSRLFSPKSFLR